MMPVLKLKERGDYFTREILRISLGNISRYKHEYSNEIRFWERGIERNFQMNVRKLAKNVKTFDL
jgi:hypothetical protein